MIAYKTEERMPLIDEEEATEDYCNKNAIFITGEFIFEDIDKKPLEKHNTQLTEAAAFRIAL